MSKTLGESRVRINFNLSGSTIVDQLKVKSAELIDLLESMKKEIDPEQYRLIALAQTGYEEAAMWAVKAATYGL